MKSKFIAVTFFVLVALVIGLQAEEQVTIKDMQPMCYAAMEFKGSYNQMEKAIGQFMQEFFKQGLKPVGPVLGVYHNNPMQVKEEELLWEVGWPIPEGTEVKEPLKKRKTEFKKAAVYLHIGPYENMDKAYEKVFKFIEAEGYEAKWPCFDNFLNDPSTVKAEELKTLVIIPVKKKEK